MFIGEEKVFNCPRPFVYSSVYDKTPFVEMANESQSPLELYNHLRDAHISHLVINVPESIRLKGYNLYPWVEGKKSLVKDFFQSHTRIVAIRSVQEVNGLILLALEENSTEKNTWAYLSPALEPALEL